MPLRFLLPFITAISAIVAFGLALALDPAPASAATTAAVVQKLCAGGQVVGYSAKCPTAGTVRKICADGSVVGYSAKCPVAVTYQLTGGIVPAGNHEPFILTRSSSVAAALVTFTTGDGTAHAGTDYMATSKAVAFAIGQASATQYVSTSIGAPGPNLTFYGQIIAGGRIAAQATGTIMEPAPPAPPPPPATKTCPDGSVILATATCPVPPPPPPAPLPLTAGGRATATSNCPATNRPESAVAGQTYNLIEFAHDAAGAPLAVLSDATHRGDGWFSLYVPVGCLVGA